jgi:hypothetical protein
MTEEKTPRVALTPARVAEIDEAMWLRAREGDVAAAKVVYARLSEVLPPAPPLTSLPKWEDIEAMFYTIQQQQKGYTDEPRVLDDTINLGAGPLR